MIARRFALLVAVSLLAPSLATAQVVLQTKVENGIHYQLKENVTTDQSLALGGQSFDTHGEVTVVSEVRHGQRDNDGKLPVSTTFKKIVAKMALPDDITLEFDSANPDKKADNDSLEIVLDRFRALVDLKITHTVDSMGKVDDIEGVTQESGLDKTELQSNYQQNLDRIPATPLNVGDKWEKTEEQNLGGGQVFKFKRIYEYQGEKTVDGRKFDEITAKDESVEFFIREGGQIPGKVTKSDLSVDSSQHTLLFDREKGRVVDMKSRIRVKGNVALEIAGNDLEGTLDLTMDSRRQDLP
jgi:hypothetical protein